MTTHGRGVLFSLTATSFFGGMYYYSTLLYPLSGMQIFGWRMVFTVPFLTLLLVKTGHWPLVAEIGRRVKKEILLLPLLLLSATLLGVQLWLFLWAPINGKALQVSLGYLLFPLVMVLVGMVFFKEKLLLYQKIGIVFAILGVINQLYGVGSLSWETLFVALGFPAYFALRRKIQTHNLGGLWFDCFFMLPASLFIAVGGEGWLEPFHTRPALWALVVLLGILSALANSCLMMANKLLPLGTFGMLSYLEPVLLVIVSLILGERIQTHEILTYLSILLAVAVLAFGTVRAEEGRP